MNGRKKIAIVQSTFCTKKTLIKNIKPDNDLEFIDELNLSNKSIKQTKCNEFAK